MSKLNYLFKSLLFFKKQHLAVLAGTIISTAVLTGALMVGDAVKNTLSQMVEYRLGKTQYVLQSNDRFVSTKMADAIANKLNVKSATGVLLGGVSSNPENECRINKTQVLGIDSSFWLISDKKMPDLTDDEAIISSNTAEKLKLKVNDEFVLKVEKLSVIPLNSPFSNEEIPSVSFRLKIKAIADNESMGRFSLKSNQVAPYNVFMSRTYLSSHLDINGLANLVLIAAGNQTTINTNLLNRTMSEVWQLKDAGIEINKLDSIGNYELTSNRIFIDHALSKSLDDKKIGHTTLLSYLVNSIRLKEKSTPYSFVSAVSENFSGKDLRDNNIIINEWLAEDLNAKKGDTVTLTYFVIDAHRKLKEDSNRFVVKEVIPTRNASINRTLMPKFPGFANAIRCMEWNTNLPIDLRKIRDKDETFWNEFRGTPKAIISKAAGKMCWQNNFGDYTAIRFNDSVFSSISSTLKPEQQILKLIDPGDFNLSFVDARTLGKQAAESGVNFGELFVSLSFFVILAGIILTVMLYALSLEARKSEIGLLMSMGYTKKQIMNLRISENTITVLLGSLLGVIAGILYNYGLLTAINSVWSDIVRTPMMDVSIKPMTLFTGALSGFEISMLSIYVITYFNLKKTATGLINNNFQTIQKRKNRKNKLAIILIIFGLLASLGLVLYSVLTSVNYNAGLFLLSGGLFMMASWIFTGKMISPKTSTDIGNFSLSSLAFRNASRNRNRSLSIVILLSIGVFVVIITGSNRKTFYGSENINQSGTGGYSLWAETTVALTIDLNTAAGKEKAGLGNDSILNNVGFVQFLSFIGDDASCLNLNHVEKPGVIGVNPGVFDKRSSFSFETLKSGVDKEHPWLELNTTYADNVIPAFADQTVITWGIIKKIGDTLSYINEKGKKLYLVLAGGLNSSVFQGNILIAEQHFKENFPSVSGSKLLMVDAPLLKQKAVTELLNKNLIDYGIEIIKTNERLSEFNSVTNTYLSVFMILGGLGLIIGSFGIGILLFRNLTERKQEMALLMAVGFSRQQIFKLIFSENLFLIIIGMTIGLASSFIGILPSLITLNFHTPDPLFLFLLLILIFINALLWIYLPIFKALKENIITSLRSE
jgi:ABC-type antimicrobial peptide transport system permease subunit